MEQNEAADLRKIVQRLEAQIRMCVDYIELQLENKEITHSERTTLSTALSYIDGLVDPS